MSRRSRTEAVRLLVALHADPAARLVLAQGGWNFESPAGSRAWPISGQSLKHLTSSGLIEQKELGRFAASSAAEAWLKRQDDSGLGFRAQHGEIGPAALADGTIVLKNLQESPIALLCRPCGGRPAWLPPHAVAAAERLRGDFEVGQLQPRITANWSATVATGRRAGDGAGLRDLTDMAVAARLRFDRAMHAVGPDLSGVLVDVCCFLKGLETVERERQWPARSAKLVLRLALDSLARHYGLAAEASGKAAGRLRHWGSEDYRPQIT